MRFLGYNLTVTKAPVAALSAQNASALMPIDGGGGGFLGRILEPFAGAWQRNIHGPRNEREITAFSAVYACIAIIADDISKCRLKLVEFDTGSKVWQEVFDPRVPHGAVLRKPNHFQTRIQFLSQWIISKKLFGNTYVYKVRDERNMVSAMYVLDPRLVKPHVDAEGGIWYGVNRDPLSQVFTDSIMIPANEIIHDRDVTLFHPLCGVSPIYACGVSAMQGLGIQVDSETFFRNRAVPGGALVAPGEIGDKQLERIKKEWQENFGAGGKGLTAILQGGVKWEAFRMNAVDAQLIEQLRWTVEDVARCFKMPLHMLGVQGSNPSYNNIAALTQAYYSQCLQNPIEALELLLDEGLGLTKAGYGSELDLEVLMRMDPPARIDASAKGVGAGILTPNEARAREDLRPITGGDQAYLQQQNYSLAALAKRDAQADPFAAGAPPPPAAPEPPEPDDETDEDADDEREFTKFGVALIKAFVDEAALIS